jgi:hypothetical protein
MEISQQLLEVREEPPVDSEGVDALRPQGIDIDCAHWDAI